MSGSGEEDADDADEVYFTIRDFFRRRMGDDEQEYFDAIENALSQQLRGLNPITRAQLLGNLRQQYEYGDGGNPGAHDPPGGEEIDIDLDILRDLEEEEESEANTEQTDDDDDEEFMVDAIGQDPGGGDNQGDRVGLVQLGGDENAQQELINVRSPRRVASPPPEVSRSFHAGANPYTATSSARTGHSVTMSQATATASSLGVSVTSVAAASQPHSSARPHTVSSPPAPDSFNYSDDSTPYGTPEFNSSAKLGGWSTSLLDLLGSPGIETTVQYATVPEPGCSSGLRATSGTEGTNYAVEQNSDSSAGIMITANMDEAPKSQDQPNRSDANNDNDQTTENNDMNFYECEAAIEDISNNIQPKASSANLEQDGGVEDGFVTPPTNSDNEDIFEDCYVNKQDNSGDAHFFENLQGNTYASRPMYCPNPNESDRGPTLSIDEQSSNQNNGDFEADTPDGSEEGDRDSDEQTAQEENSEPQVESSNDGNQERSRDSSEQTSMDATNSSATTESHTSIQPQFTDSFSILNPLSSMTPRPLPVNSVASSHSLINLDQQVFGTALLERNSRETTVGLCLQNSGGFEHFSAAQDTGNSTNACVYGGSTSACVFGMNPLDVLESRYFHVVGAHQSFIHGAGSQDSGLQDRSSSQASNSGQHQPSTAAPSPSNFDSGSRTAETSSNAPVPDNPETPASPSTPGTLTPPPAFQDQSVPQSPAGLGDDSNAASTPSTIHAPNSPNVSNASNTPGSQDNNSRDSNTLSTQSTFESPSPPTPGYYYRPDTPVPPLEFQDPLGASGYLRGPPLPGPFQQNPYSPIAPGSQTNRYMMQAPGNRSMPDNNYLSHPLSPSPPDRPTTPIPQNDRDLLDLDLQNSDVWLNAGPSHPQNPISPSAADTFPAWMRCGNNLQGTAATSNPDPTSYLCLTPLPDILNQRSPSAPGTSSAHPLDIGSPPMSDILAGIRASANQGPVEESGVPGNGPNYQELPQYPQYPQQDQYYDPGLSPGSTPDFSPSPDYPATPDHITTPEMMSEDEDEEDSLEAELGIAAEQALYEEARFDEMFDEAHIAAEPAEEERLLDDEDPEHALRQNELQQDYQEPHRNVNDDDDDDISYQLVQPIRVEPEGRAHEEANNDDNDNDNDNDNDEGYIDEDDENIAANIEIPNGVVEQDGMFQVILNGQVINAENWQQWIENRVNNPPGRNNVVELQLPPQRDNNNDGAVANRGFIQNVVDENGNILYTIYGINLGDDGQVVQGVYAHPNPGMDDIDGDDELSDDGPLIGPLYTLSRDIICDVIDSSIARLGLPAIEQGPSGSEPEESTGIDWSVLPMNVVTEIMCYLSDADRVRMAKTCKKWHSLLNSACLWRIRIIRFHGSGTKAKAEAKRLKGWATCHGNWLQRLSIYCDHPSYVVCRTFQKAMTDFFGTLLWQKTSLRRFCMRRLYVERYWRYDTVRERLVGSLSRFLKRQSHLQYIDLSDGHWGLINGLKILEALAQGCKGSRRLATLNLEDFFSSHLSIFSLSRYQNVLSKFKGLSEVYTNYSCVSDEIVETLARNCEGRLKLLSVKIYRTEPHTHTVAPGTWRLATRLCRALRVEVYIEGMGNFDDIGGILAKDMPLRMLQIWTGIHPVDQNWRTDRLFQHVATHYAPTIEEAYMSVEPEGEAIDSAVVEMLEKCKLLDSVDLQTTLEVDTLETIYQKVNEHKILATRLHINLNNLTGVEMEMLEAVNERWAPMVDERRLNYVFEANELVLF